MAFKVEGAVNRGMHAEEALGSSLQVQPASGVRDGMGCAGFA
jgi:hypothetical protein